MRGLKVCLAVAVAFALCFLLSACGGGSPPVKYKALKIQGGNPPNGNAQVVYGYTFTATGGLPPYNWTVSAGSPPPGLTLNATTGVLSGTPTTMGVSNFTVQVTDAQTPTAAMDTSNVKVTINAAPDPLTITSKVLPVSYVNNSYSTTLTATGGVTPYTWSVSSGSLPSGLSLDQNKGIISGVATILGTTKFTIQVTDSATTPETATQDLSINVTTPTALSITTTSIPAGTKYTSYNTQLQGSGGVQPYVWTVQNLPMGLSLNSTTGVISGKPTQTGPFMLAVALSDSEPVPQMVSTSLNLTVSPAPTLVITTTALPAAVANGKYSATVTATGGIPPYTWTFSGEPSWLIPDTNNSGTLSGMPPAAAGPVTFTATATDSEPSPDTQMMSQTLAIAVNSPTPLTLNTTKLPDGIVNNSYSFLLSATGGVMPYTWQESGTLPAGINPIVSAIIDGVPTTAGPSGPLTIKVSDSSMPALTATVTLSLNVDPNPNLTIVTPALARAVVGVPYKQNLHGEGGTQSTANCVYTWSKTSGNLPLGVTLGTNGTISGTPASGAVGGAVTIQLKDCATPAATASMTYNLAVDPVFSNSTLTGNYAFSFSGFDKGSPVMMAGSFVADGNGNITSGVLDLNNTTAPVNSVSLTGTYTVGSNGLGTITLNAGSVGMLNWQIAVPTSGAIRFIQNGNSADTETRGSGFIQKQKTSDFVLANLAGNYVLGFTGVDTAGKRTATAGAYQVDSSGVIQSGATLDINDNGTTNNYSFSGSYTAGPDSTTGRGTATITVNGVNYTYVFYVVSAGELIVLENDPAATPSLTDGLALRQASSSFTNASLTGNSIMGSTGIGGGSPDVQLGLANFDGTSAFTLAADENAGGTLTLPSFADAYTVMSNGRTTFNAMKYPAILYLYDQNKALVLGTDATVKAGFLEGEPGTPFLVGTYNGGSLAAALPSATVEAKTYSFNGYVALSVTVDTSGPLGYQAGTTGSGYFLADTPDRTIVNIGGTAVYIVYAISSSAIAEMSTDNSPKLDYLQH